ncbi:TetR/AcrR family transcriptional regulator [Sphaerisporangium corydalis]|uniref:TetR/AcrR family transcriptional regulator n=1 Tax=Sphaerisporangium corydalis TaxID=1441875 RepID=A0ABV9ENK6_9ACTN|nr:TetR/AcrR family transcriptional regulator [Sphaerisporangium corydalis]
MGLREIKKEQTRRLLVDTAKRLFAQRGFDKVRVAEVAQEAQVSEATVFKYFPTKEDLFYSGLDEFGDRLVTAVRTREPGTSALAGCRDFLLKMSGGLLAQIEHGDQESYERLRTINRVISASAALQARERQSVAGYIDALAGLLAEETGGSPDDLDAFVAAHALIGVQQTMVAYVRRRILADDRPETLAADVGRVTSRAFDLLEQGLGDYAIKR